MSTSLMANRIDAYMQNPALFNTDLLFRVNKWKANYIIPIANAFEDGKNRVNGCVAEAKQRAEKRFKAYQELKAKIDFGMGIMFSLFGPYLSAAYSAQRIESLKSLNNVLDDRLLSKAIAKGMTDDSALKTIMTRSTVRSFILNDITEHRLPELAGKVKEGMSPGAGPEANVPEPTGKAPTGSVNLPGVASSQLTMETSADGLARNMEQVFLTLAGDLNDKFMAIFVDNQTPAPLKRLFLQVATKTLIVRPPAKPLDEFVGSAQILGNLFFGLLASNYLLSFKAEGGEKYPRAGVDLGFTINKGFKASGFSIVTNNPKPGVKEEFGWGDEQMAWDGMIFPWAQTKKLVEIGTQAAITLEAYMMALGMTKDAV